MTIKTHYFSSSYRYSEFSYRIPFGCRIRIVDYPDSPAMGYMIADWLEVKYVCGPTPIQDSETEGKTENYLILCRLPFINDGWVQRGDVLEATSYGWQKIY
jgi:hypothetical protein